MSSYKEVKGDLISMAKLGHFDLITHGCNCFCTQYAGIANQMRANFGTNDFPLENDFYYASINKLGAIDYKKVLVPDKLITVVNSYTQYLPGKELNLVALEMCLIKLNHTFRGKTIGLPKIGTGIAGGKWWKVKRLIKKTLTDMNVIVVIYNK